MDKELKVNSDTILDWAKEQVEKNQDISREMWLDMAFKLNLLRLDEAKLYNEMFQAVGIKKVKMKQGQAKVNISAIELDIEASDEYRFLKDQEDKIYTIDQMIMIAKKNSDVAY